MGIFYISVMEELRKHPSQDFDSSSQNSGRDLFRILGKFLSGFWDNTSQNLERIHPRIVEKSLKIQKFPFQSFEGILLKIVEEPGFYGLSLLGFEKSTC